MLGPDYTKRDYLLPKGCKDLMDVINLQKEKLAARWHMTEGDVEMRLAELEAELQHTSGHVPPITGEILVSATIVVAELARLLCQKPFKIVADLMEVGVFANVKQSVSFEAACKVARKYGYAAKKQT